MRKIQKLIVIVFVLISLIVQNVEAQPVLSFANREALQFEKILRVGEVEIIEFANPVSLAHYGTNEASLDYIELEKLGAEANGYRKFMVKAKRAGSGELTFKSGDDFIKVKVIVEDDYSALEEELNKLFGIVNANADEKIQVVSANMVSSLPAADIPHIYLKGHVESAKQALLAVAFAANAVGDHGVKIFSNPGGQLRLKDLDSQSIKAAGAANSSSKDISFVDSYEAANKLIDTNNLYRDLILASEQERVISYLQVKEPKRFAVKVRFLEMDSKYVDEFVSSINVTMNAGDLKGALGTTGLIAPNITKVADLGGAVLTDSFSGSGITRLASQIVSGNLISGTTKLLDNAFLNVNLNNLLQEGVLRVVNEFSLITHSGEMVSLGKGTRFPVPKQNNGVGNTAISFEYISIGFKGELKVTGLENNLIDVQLASRLSAAEAAVATVQGISIPIFSEEYVNSGALLSDGQEVVLNAFMTESETISKSASPLGRVIPLLGRAKRKKRSKDLLFIALVAEEIEASSKQVRANELQLPHVDMAKSKNIYVDYNTRLREKGITDTVDLSSLNSTKSNPVIVEPALKVDPLDEEGLEL
jgi:Flp pilus assembly secretin CpaC